MQAPTLREFLTATARLQRITSEQVEALEDQAPAFVTREELAEWEVAFLERLERRLKQEREYQLLFISMRTSIAASILQRLRRILPGALRESEYDDWLKQRAASQESIERNAAWTSI